jgi:hypothetical protein
METNQERTKEEQHLDLPPAADDFNSLQYDAFLQSLFNLGEIRNRTIEVFQDFKVTLRVLTPVENIEVMKRVDEAPGNTSRNLIFKLEVLSRAIEKINGQYLRFSESMLSEWHEFTNKKEIPTEVEQQRYILKYRTQQFVLDEIFKSYEGLLEEQKNQMIDLKKNLKITPS